MSVEYDNETKEYQRLVKRALEKIPVRETQQKERLELPTITVNYLKLRTVVENFQSYFDLLRRDSKDVASEISKKIGYRSVIQNGSLVLMTRISNDKIDLLIEEYVDRFIRCAECHKLDTAIIIEGKHKILHCEVCGAEKRLT